jgi:hypothetical protein
LERIEEILRKELTYSASVYDRYSSLSEGALRGKLLEIAHAVHEECAQKSSLIEKLFRKIFHKKSAIANAYDRIEILVNPPPIFPLPNEMALRILSFLSLVDLGRMARVNKKSQNLALRAQFERAREYHYPSQSTLTVETYLHELLRGIVEYYVAGKIPADCVVFRSKKFLKAFDVEATLRKLLLAKSKGILNVPTDAFLLRAAEGKKRIVFAAVVIGADIHARDGAGHTALTYAVAKGQKVFAQLLIANRADVNRVDAKGNTPLMYTTNETGHPKLTQLLLENGALNSIDQINNAGYTALHLGAKKNLLEVVQQLVAHGADKTLLGPEGMTAMELASAPRVREVL